MAALRPGVWLLCVGVALLAAVLGVLTLHGPIPGAGPAAPGPRRSSAEATAGGLRFRASAEHAARRHGDQRSLRSPSLRGPIAAVWPIVRLAFFAAVLLGLGLVASRLHSRRGRTMERVLVTPGRSSEASPAQIAGLIEALGSISRERWWVRLWRGTPPAATLELVAGVHPGGTREQRIAIAVPRTAGNIEALRGVLASRYPDATLTPLGEATADALRPWLREIIRLKKAKLFARPLDRPLERSLASAEPYQEAPVDTLLSVMAEVEERVLVQIAISPVPLSFQKAARSIAVRRRGPAGEAAGPDAVEQREERASTDAVVFRPLFFCDLRVGAESYRVARHVAGAIAGHAEGGENQLRQRRPVLRRHLYLERMMAADSNPLPSWWRGVYSSLEIAGFWQLPTPFAKNVAVERSNVPQLATPPEVFRPAEARLAIATDLRGGFVGIRREDWKYGFQASGAQGSGKTSVLAKVAELRAREADTAVIVIDLKDEVAEAAASSIPAWRHVRYLDIGEPLFGMSLHTADGDLQREASIFSEAMVDVSRTEEGESQALNASQRSFKMARGATLALEEDPTFWHTARWLAPDDSAARWREEKIAKLAGDPEWHAVWDHFARILPAQLKMSPSQAVMRLEAPYNKIQTLLGDSRLNAVLHHPVKISLDQVIRRREVLIIAGRVPDHPDGVVFLKFAIQLAHRAILAQQKLPEDERARVAVIIDDAGTLLGPTIARMMEHDRAAGLDLTLGWQHGGQMSPELAQAIDGLCHSRFYFRSAQEDAKRAINRLNPSYDDRLSGELSELKRTRVEVNQLTNLDNHHAVAVLQSGKTLSSSFVVRTIPWRRDPERLEEIKSRMREEGAYDPQVIAPPRELTGRSENEALSDVGGEADRQGSKENGTPAEEISDTEARTAVASGPSGPSAPPEEAPQPASPPERAPEEGGGGGSVRRGRREAEVAPLGTATDKPLSDGYHEVELMRERGAGITWEKPKSEPAQLRHNAINFEQRSVLEALHELRVLSAGQIQREFMISAGERQVRRELSALVSQRMIKRAELGLRGVRGRGKRIYVLDTAGFEFLRDMADHEAGGSWRPPELHSAQHAVHDLVRNEWLFAFRALAPRQLAGWHGPRASKIEVPLVKERRGPARKLTPADLQENAPLDSKANEFTNLIPDLTLELILTKPGGEGVKTDLLAEIESGNNDATVRGKARDYDSFLTGWWRSHSRYQDLGRPPILFFIVPDVKRATRFIELLDEVLTSYVLGPAQTQTRDQRERGITPVPKRLYLGRRNVFVAVGKDLSQRTLRSWRVPAEPPAERVRQARNAADRRAARRPLPRPFMLIPPGNLVNPAS